MNSAVRKILLCCAILAPFFLTIVFVFWFASPTPLTDEWLLVGNAMIADEKSWRQLIESSSEMRWTIYDHPLVVPNLIYLAIAPHVSFDARVMILITVGCFIAVAIAMRRAGLSLFGTFVASLILACPSHYMEFLWGFQFTLTASIWLPVLGLVALDRGPHNGRPSAKSLLVFAGLTTLGLLSSAPAAFGLLGAVALIALKPMPRLQKAIIVLMLFGAFVAVAAILRSSGGGGGLSFNIVAFALTAVGVVLLGSPVGLFDFGMDLRSILGGALLIPTAILFVAAGRRGHRSSLALPAALIAYGLLMISAVALARGYLGNWHAQMAMPVVLGAILLADRLWPAADRSERVLSGMIFGITLTALVGAWQGFTTWGPSYANYTLSITQYMRDIRTSPAEKPFPATGGWDVTPEMVEFLARKGNPSFVAQ